MARKAKPTKIEDVARRANVSIMTVSRAIRGVEGVSEKKRAEILKIARQLKYVPNSNARSLAVANSNLIGISLPTFAGEVFADILSGMRRTFDTAGYSSVIDTTEYNRDSELAWIRRLLSWQPAAIILTGIDHHVETRQLLRAAPLPVLEIWDLTDDPIDVCVGIDHFEAGRVMGEHARDMGYCAPAFVSTPRGHDIRADARLSGIRGVFQPLGADVVTARPPLGNAFSTGFDGTRALLAGPRPDVIFYLNDHMAFGGMMACNGQGLDVPGDMGIVGFNGLDLTSVLPIRLTTVQTPRRLMGITCARTLLARINGVCVPKRQALEVEFRAGDTTRLQSGADRPQ
ncbi:MAG: LacI family DNA-binding transcriptional regulator [Sedimentitalea sp.]